MTTKASTGFLSFIIVGALGITGALAIVLAHAWG
jgi:hypothetical protein